MKQSKTLWARKCDITNEGMNEGYSVQDGLMYIKYESDLLKHIREVEKEDDYSFSLIAEGSLTDDFLLNDYYEADYYCYTEWECEDDKQFIELDGILSDYDPLDKTELVTPNNGDSESTYIDYLNKDKNFKQDRIEFKSYEDAVKWAKENLEKFNLDMIHYN